MPGEIMTFDDYVLATSEPGTDPYRDIEDLIHPPRRIYSGFLGGTRKLKPTGDAARDRLVAAKLQVRRTQED